MDSATFESLKRFYQACRDRFQFHGKLRGESLLISGLEVKNNVRFSLLGESSIESRKIDADHLSELVTGEFIREIDEPGRYTITARGIWEVERSEHLLDDAKLVRYIDQKNFALFTKARLTEKEKVIVFSLIAVRAFSVRSCVDLHRDDATMEAWRRIIETAYKTLRGLGIVRNLSEAELLRAKGTERPLSHLIRHTDALPRKTKGIFRAPGKQRYYLDLYDGTTVPMDRLAFMFRLVFEGELDLEGMESVLEVCRSVAYDEAIHVFDYPEDVIGVSEHLFSKPMYDDVVRDALHRSLVQVESH